MPLELLRTMMQTAAPGVTLQSDLTLTLTLALILTLTQAPGVTLQSD